MEDFRLLMDSDYWQYLPASTRDRVLDLLGEHRWPVGRNGCRSDAPEIPPEAATEKILKTS